MRFLLAVDSALTGVVGALDETDVVEEAGVAVGVVIEATAGLADDTEILPVGEPEMVCEIG